MFLVYILHNKAKESSELMISGYLAYPENGIFFILFRVHCMWWALSSQQDLVM